VIPSDDVAVDAALAAPPLREAKNVGMEDAHVTCLPITLAVTASLCVHVTASGLDAIAAVPDPTATHRLRLDEYTIPLTWVVNGVVLVVHVMPSGEVANLFVPDPPTAQRL
jgi:hypothetical protein